MSKKIHVRPVLWTAVAGYITYVNYRNGFTDKQIDSHVIEIDENGEDVTVTSHTGFGRYSYEAERNDPCSIVCLS